MLKFHINDTTVLSTFEDFIITVFVIIDDLYNRYAPKDAVSWMPRCRIQKSLHSAFAGNWPELTPRMHGIPS